jgi:uncharacterized membrane protein
MADIVSTTKSALQTASKANPAKDGGPLSGPKGIAAAGVALVALPLAVEQIAKRAAPKVADKASDLKGKAKQKATEQVKETVDEATPDMPKGLFGGDGLLGGMFGGKGKDDKGKGKDDKEGEEGDGEGRAAPGYGSGRRMPIEQAVDIGAPVKETYNQWTQFEDWPDFMHRLESVEQADDTTVSFQAKAWGITKRFEAEIIEQRPDERIEWNVTEGFAHTGVVTFHELGERLTRIELTMDVEPSNIVDKASRGMRFVKRAVRGDLHRFKAYMELKEEAEGGWRGTIEDGEVKRRTERKSSSSRSSGGRSRGSRNGSSANGKARSSSGQSKSAKRS